MGSVDVEVVEDGGEQPERDAGRHRHDHDAPGDLQQTGARPPARHERRSARSRPAGHRRRGPSVCRHRRQRVARRQHAEPLDVAGGVELGAESARPASSSQAGRRSPNGLYVPQCTGTTSRADRSAPRGRRGASGRGGRRRASSPTPRSAAGRRRSAPRCPSRRTGRCRRRSRPRRRRRAARSRPGRRRRGCAARAAAGAPPAPSRSSPRRAGACRRPASCARCGSPGAAAAPPRRPAPRR